MFNKLFSKQPQKPKETERRLQANNPIFNLKFKYATNYIKTSKYTFVSFLPKNLFEQFQRLANFYFLVLMILQCIPAISSLRPWTTVIPLVFVLLVTAIKDAYDDIQRHRSDNQVNNREAHVVRGGKLVTERWQHVNVGDIIRVEGDNFIAADLLILSSSEPYGLCYIETSELDGETNLKPRQALEETFAMGDDLRKISAFDGQVICEPPNMRFGAFDGQLNWRQRSYPLNNDKMLLRGCVLRNTKWCYGLVIFTGRDTKLMMNSGKTKFKRTSLDRFLNVLIIGIVIFLMSMCVICTILSGIWENVYGVDFQSFLPWETIVPQEGAALATSVAFIAFLVFFSYAILMNTVVPISLYVSVEIIRFYHSWFINWDKEMYHEQSDTAARARTTTLNEELGQIQYIFSDKTGTLTQNIMAFNKCVIDGKLYGEVLDAKNAPIDIKTMKPIDFSWNKWHEKKFKWYDERLLVDLKCRKASDNDSLNLFWRLLALCHTVMPEMKEGERLIYQAQSPDEGALTTAARCMGFVFKSRTPSSITIEVNGEEEVYELLCILDFNNVRKRMSVLVRRNSEITLFCKGADTIIYERLRRSQSKQEAKIVEETQVSHFHSLSCAVFFGTGD